MKNDFVAVLDFGSSKITCMVAEKVAESSEFVIKAVGQSLYNGYDEEKFYEPELLNDGIENAIVQVENKLKCKIKEVYVGVPGAFSAIATGESSLTFHSKKRIDNDDINELIKKAYVFDKTEDMFALKGVPVYYVVDGINRNNPVGSVANKIVALVSFCFVKNYFKNIVTSALNSLGISKITYVGGCEAQAQYVASTYAENNHVIVIDVGYITTNVMLSGGNSLLFQRSFSLGSGYFAGDLCQIVGCDYNVAVHSLNRLNLNREFQQGDCYSVDNQLLNANQTNEVVKARIEQIADYVIQCFNYCDKAIPRTTPIVLTGGGLTYIRGAADYLASCLGKQIVVYDSANPQTRRNEYTSCYGLIEKALQMHKPKHSWFIFGK